MALTIADVLAMPVLQRGAPTVLTGQSSLHAGVRWVHSAEVVDIAHLLRGGELVLTTGIALPDDAEALTAYARALALAGAVGLVVELGQRWTSGLPDTLIDACRQAELPLVALAREVRFAEIAQTVGEHIVDKQLFELRAVEQVHETFTRLSVAGAGPADILAEVARASGLPVVLESFHHQVLGYDAGPAAASDLLSGWEDLSQAIRQERRTAYDERAGWLVTVVGARGDDWGRLLLQTHAAPPYRHVVLVEQASAALALHRLHARERDSIERQTHSALLVALASGEVTDELITRCDGAGIPLTGRVVGLALRPVMSGATASFNSEQHLGEIAATAADAARACEVPALVAVIDDTVWMLVSPPARRPPDAAVEQVARAVQRQGQILIGAGTVADAPDGIDRSLAEARHVVRATRTPHGDRLVHRLEDVHVRGLVHLLGDDERLRLFADRELGALLRARDADGLIAAVRALLTHPGSKAAAAASLHVSRPVFYDRLAKAERILGVDLADGEVRTALHLALLAQDRR